MFIIKVFMWPEGGFHGLNFRVLWQEMIDQIEKKNYMKENKRKKITQKSLDIRMEFGIKRCPYCGNWRKSKWDYPRKNFKNFSKANFGVEILSKQ